ncbi:MAG: NAD(P)H-binding protein [Planctomycetota bacterium]|nr:NAD(P)H-binding protein [Planctomycetota bacterium]MDG1985786.1 NAD(P)H-binding protein [Planctomycetota bacterium]
MEPPDPVAFVFGATGYVGRAVVEAAARTQGVGQVIAHARPGSSRGAALEAGVGGSILVDRTPLELSPLAHALEACRPSHLFICHGTTARRARREGLKAPYEAVDLGLTRLLLEAAAAVSPPPRVVYLSAIGASPRARGAYLRNRWLAEEAVRSSGLPFTICRAPLLGGPDRREPRPMETLARTVADPTLAVLGAVGFTKLRDRLSSMNAAEAAEGLVRSGFHYMTINRVVQSDELRRVGVYERERWTPESRRDTPRH